VSLAWRQSFISVGNGRVKEIIGVFAMPGDFLAPSPALSGEWYG
jgi:hypothetical protein